MLLPVEEQGTVAPTGLVSSLDCVSPCGTWCGSTSEGSVGAHRGSFYLLDPLHHSAASPSPRMSWLSRLPAWGRATGGWEGSRDAAEVAPPSPACPSAPCTFTHTWPWFVERLARGGTSGKVSWVCELPHSGLWPGLW